jgi:hypothetical protein
MTKEKTTPKPADEAQDAIVENDPGEAERTLAADQQQDEGGKKPESDEGESKAPEYFKDEAREAIFANAKKTSTRRSVGTYQGTDQPARAFPKQDDDQAAVEAAETLADAPERKTTAEPTRVSDEDLDKLVPVTVFGKTVWKPLRELQANAQMYDAADVRLNQVKELADRVERVRDDLTAKTSTPATESGQSKERQDDQDQIDLRDVVDKIQTGTPEEGAKALEGLLARTKGAEQLSPQQIAQIARATVEEAETNKGLVQFSESVSHDFIEDENLQHMMQGVARREMLKDLEAILPKEHLDKLEQMGRSDPRFVRTVHARARQMYPGRLRDDVALMQASHSEASQILGRKTNTGTTATRTPAPPASSVRPAPELRARQEVKRQIVQSPARRTAPAAQTDARPVSQEERRSQRVAEIRKARGQPM